MFEFIEGTLIDMNPACCIVQTGGIGYHIQITLTTYSKLAAKQQVKLFLHQVVREDAHLLYGFHTREERETFRQLLSVSGIGANTARMMLSSLTSDEIHQAIINGNAAVLQGIKGIGLKTAQRVIIDLRDKISKEKNTGELFTLVDNSLKDEALSALVILGFNKTEADKVIGKILTSANNLTLEDLIRKALKQL